MKSDMLKFGFILLFFLSSISCISNSTFESLKIGVSPFNNAGNSFFNLIRGDVNSSALRLDEFSNMTISCQSFKKVASVYLSHLILMAIGISFVVLLPIAGLMFCVYRCCGKCGGKTKSMDPRHVKCKRLFYGLILTVLVIGMMFSAAITLFNNQLVHESVSNSDESINIFVRVKSHLDKLRSNMKTMKSEIMKAEPSRIDSEHMQPMFRNLQGAIGAFYDNLMNVTAMHNLIQQSKSLSQAINEQDLIEYRNYVENLNNLLSSSNSNLSTIKDDILNQLDSCRSTQCEEVKTKTRMLQISQIDTNKLHKFVTMLNYLLSKDLHEALQKMVKMKANGQTDMKLVLDKEINYIKDQINNKSFSDSVKTLLVHAMDRGLEIEKMITDYIPSPNQNDSRNYEYYQNARIVEYYRYNIYIGLGSIIILIVIFYFLGLIYGNCGERPEEDARCFNRGVGANFLMISITLTFLMSSVIMVVVLTQLMSTNIVQTDLCRYASKPLENSDHSNGYPIMDKYLQMALHIAGVKQNLPDGFVESLLQNCENQNLYMSFANISKEFIIQGLQKQFDNTENKTVSMISNHLDLSKYLNNGSFSNLSRMELDNLINAVNLTMPDSAVASYINDLDGMPMGMKSEIARLQSIVNSISQIRLRLQQMAQQLTNIQNNFIKWSAFANTFNENRTQLIRMCTPDLMKSIKNSMMPVMNLLFGTMFHDVSCANFRTNTMALTNGLCENLVNLLNGCWYGLGFFLLLVIPAMVFAVFLVSLYRRVQKFYPDKDEPDYENYIGFYARADGEAMKSQPNKQPHRGYRPIPLQ